MAFEPGEIREVHDRFLAMRAQIERLERPWSALAAFFTENATYVDPAWGRVVGIDEIRRFLDDSMRGLDGWTFPTEWTVIDGDLVVSHWLNRLPGRREDGSHYEVPAVSILRYAGNGRFASSEDILNMIHVHELIRESGWKPGPGALAPPRQPAR